MAQAGQPEGYDDDLTRIEASIADLMVRDMAAAKERTDIAAKIQAAQFQRDILAHANQQKKAKAAKTRRVRRTAAPASTAGAGPATESNPAGPGPAAGARSAGGPKPATTTGSRPAEGRRPATVGARDRASRTDGGATLLVDDLPPTQRGPAPPRRGAGFTAPENHPPEASSQSVQNILLALGALLIGVAAVVFAGVAVSNPFARATILAISTTIALVVAPGIAKRGLSSTAETISWVGLILLPMTLLALHGSPLAGGRSVPVPLYLGIAFALTTVAAFWYAALTRLNAPRYGTVIAAQPVPLLLAYPLIQSPAGWGMALSVVAVLDLLLLTTVIRTGRLVPHWPIIRASSAPRTEPDPHTVGVTDFHRHQSPPTDPAPYDVPLPPRPESAPEEPDLIIHGLAGSRGRWVRARLSPSARAGRTAQPTPPRASSTASADWLRELTFALLCVASAGALLYSTVGLLQARTVSDAARSGLILVLAALAAAAAARLLDNAPARNIAGAVLTLAVIGAAARVADVISPHLTLIVAAAAVAITGVVVRRLVEQSRRGPQLASAVALTLIGLFVGVDALRAALAPVQAARPIWHADTADYARRIAEAAGPSGWLLAFSALLLTIAAALALPTDVRHEGAVAGGALTALSVPASLALPWSEAPWPLVLAGVGLGGAGLFARTRRIAIAHVAAAGVVGLFGAGSALSASWLTAAVLTALAGAGVMVAVAARQISAQGFTWLVGDWAAGGAALALPGAVVTGALAVNDPGGGPPATAAVTVPALALGFLAVAATLSYAAVSQVARREISLPLTVGSGAGAVALALAALLSTGATAADLWVGVLLLVAAGLLFFAKSIDVGRRSDRMLDGTDVAAAAATVAICGALARVAALAIPAAPLAVAAAMVLIVALAVRALPEAWRRGPVRGLAVAGTFVGALAAIQAVNGAVRTLGATNPIWAADLSHYPVTSSSTAWQAPFALALVAFAAALAAPRPWSFVLSAAAGALAVIGAPYALGLPWWSPLVVGGAGAIAFALGSVAAIDPRAALARAAAAAAILLQVVGAALVRPSSTGLALLLVAMIGLLVAVLARTPVAFTESELANLERPTAAWDGNTIDLARDDTGMPRHRAQIGGAATGAVLLALPGVLAAFAADRGALAPTVLTAALAAASLSLAILALAGPWIPQFLPWATAGLVLSATITAFASIPTPYPTALYAAAAALLGVLAELLRGTVPAPGLTVPRGSYWRQGLDNSTWTARRPSGLAGRWLVNPATSAVALALVPTALALLSIAPALRAALIDPLQQLGHIWHGPIPALTQPAPSHVDGTSVLAIMLLTGAAALAAIGFGGRNSEAVPVVLPGIAITLLIAPIAGHSPYPITTTAALIVFTLSMLGLALTPPPLAGRAPLLSATRTVVFVLGLLAGGAGLAGSLAHPPLTLFTMGSAVGVGLIAALAGRSQGARVLGWLFAAIMGQLFVLTTAMAAGLDRTWAAFGVLAIGAALLVLEATLPRLGQPQYRREASTVEISGYLSALLAGALAYDSPAHLAALLAAWGAILGLSATRAGRTARQRRLLFWTAVGFEIVGWWLFISLADVALPEAYTLPFAALALLVGVLEARDRPELSSWAAYGPALLAAFVPTIGIVLATDAGDLREVLLLLGAVGTLINGSRSRQQAPVVIGAVATVIAAIHFAVTLVGPWLVLVPVGVTLLYVGATDENRRRTQDRLRGALVRMR